MRSPQAEPARRLGPDASGPRREVRDGRPPAPPARRSLSDFINRVRLNGLRPNSLEPYAFAAFAVLIATLVREVFRASGADGLAVFATYYPAVLLAMLLGGRLCGVLTAVLGGFAAYYFFMPPLYELVPLTLSEALNFALYGGASTLMILIIDWYQRSVLRLRQEDARHLTLAREQGHRVRNAAAIVEAVVQQSLRDQTERAHTINRRIRAGLAQMDLEVHDLKPFGGMRDLLAAELEPYDLARFTFEGEPLAPLPPKTQSILSVVMHELAANAVKYGALSVPDGRVTVTWGLHEGRGRILWLETGGPPVQPPSRRGYGSVLLQRLVQSVGGAVVMDFRPAGLAAEISLPLG